MTWEPYARNFHALTAPAVRFNSHGMMTMTLSLDDALDHPTHIAVMVDRERRRVGLVGLDADNGAAYKVQRPRTNSTYVSLRALTRELDIAPGVYPAAVDARHVDGAKVYIITLGETT